MFYYYFATQNKLQQVITHNKEIIDIKLKSVYSWDRVTVAGKSPRSQQAYK